MSERRAWLQTRNSPPLVLTHAGDDGFRRRLDLEKREMALGHVLVVEDDYDLGLTLSDILEMAGFPVVTATDGRLALAYLQDAPPPCVILLDLMMPGMDGWEFRRRQLADPVLRKIPVIIASGWNDRRLSPEFDDVEAFFLKPYDVPKLLEVVARHCTPSGGLGAGERMLALS